MNGLDFGTAIGLIKGLGSPDPAVIESAVSDWLDDHPEATTTVQDGSITKAKLDSNLQGTVDDVVNLKSALTDISNVVVGEKYPIEMTTVSGRLVNSSGQLAAGTSYTCFVFSTEAGKIYKVTAKDNEVLRVAFSNSNTDETRQLNDVHTATDKSKYEFTTNYAYCYVFGITPGYSATFNAFQVDDNDSLKKRVENLEDNVDTLDKLTEKVIGKQVSVTLTEMSGRLVNSSGQLAAGTNYSCFILPTKIGFKYTVFAQNNEVLRVAFSNSNTDETRQLNDVHTSSSLSTIEFVSAYTYCYIFGITPGYSATFNAFECDISESMEGQIEDTNYKSRGDCKSNGKLTKNGIYVVNSTNVPVELRGVGLHALLQYKNLHGWKPLYDLKKNGVNLIRCSAYLQDNSFASSDNEVAYGYISHPDETKAEIERIIKNCIDLGIYVLIDWHHWSEKDGVVATYQTYAEEFFAYFAEKYANCPNVLYEIANEPYGDTVSSLVTFVKAIRTIIKTYVTNPIMVTGCTFTGYSTWAERCSALYTALSTEGITDVFVSPHNYGGGLYTDVNTLRNNGVPVFVTEWGNSLSSGDGQGNDNAAITQIESFHTNCVPQAIWKFTDQTMVSCLLANRGVINSEKYFFGFAQSDMSHNGVLLLGRYKVFDTTEWIDRQAIT